MSGKRRDAMQSFSKIVKYIDFFTQDSAHSNLPAECLYCHLCLFTFISCKEYIFGLKKSSVITFF